MADKALAQINASVFMDEIKSSMSGSYDYEPADANDKWVFMEKACATSNTPLLSTSQGYLQNDATFIHADDRVKWIAIKNMSTTSTDGVCIVLDNGTAAYNVADGIIIGASELLVLKIPMVVTLDINHVAVTLNSSGIPTGSSSASFNLQVAAILDDGGL